MKNFPSLEQRNIARFGWSRQISSLIKATIKRAKSCCYFTRGSEVL